LWCWCQSHSRSNWRMCKYKLSGSLNTGDFTCEHITLSYDIFMFISTDWKVCCCQ
jgi:hypothetical protein